MIDPTMGHFHDSNQAKVRFRMSLLRLPGYSGQTGVRFQDGCSDNEE